MSKKHFAALAEALYNVRPDIHKFADASPEAYQWCKCVNSVADVCRSVNPNFNRQEFLDACEYYTPR